MSTEHMRYLESVVTNIVATLKTKEAMYQGSWKKRGGTGAFFVSARKWDALESMLHKRGDYDIIWGAIEQGEGDGTIIEQIRDLVGYLLLIECEVTRLVAERKEKGEYVGLAPATTPKPNSLGEAATLLEGAEKAARVPATAEYIGDSVHKLGLHQGSVYRCFNIMSDGTQVYIRNAFNEMIWHDASLFRLTYNEGE